MPADSETVAGQVESRLRGFSGLLILWVPTLGSRGAFADELNVRLKAVAAVAIPVRGRLFENQNAVLGDVSKLLKKNRSACESGLASADRGRAICIVLVANSRLGFTQSSSPVELPDWVPIFGGTAPLVRIEDLSRSATTRLNDPIADIPAVSRAVFELEGALLDRMACLGSDGTTLGTELALGGTVYSISDWSSSHATVRDAGGFRPSTRNAASLVGGIWRYAQRTAEENRGSAIACLVDTLSLPEEAPVEWTEGILAVLARPTSRKAEFGARLARAIIAEIAGSCQFVTSAMHSGEYHLYSVSLIEEFSDELRRCLLADARILRVID